MSTLAEMNENIRAFMNAEIEKQVREYITAAHGAAIMDMIDTQVSRIQRLEACLGEERLSNERLRHQLRQLTVEAESLAGQVRKPQNDFAEAPCTLPLTHVGSCL